MPKAKATKAKDPEANDLSNYKWKNEIEHVLDAPDTYIGSIQATDYDNYIVNEGGDVEWRTIQIVPGLVNLVDEGLVNARDHAVRTQSAFDNGDAESTPVRLIDVEIHPTGVITIHNDGRGIDIAKHPEHDMWIPTLIFGNLRTSTNYNKDEDRIVGGKNGFGVKLINIWSTTFEVDTVDHTRSLRFQQVFKSNMTACEEPVVTKSKKKPYTHIKFTLDLARMGIASISDGMMSLLRRRVYDIAAVTDPRVRVRFNDTQLQVRNFSQYVKLYGNEQSASEEHARWEYIIVPSTEFRSMSFVNGIHTSKGGKHVDYIMNQLTTKIVAYVKKKRGIDVKPASIKDQVMIFLNCTITNPSFDSQTKDFLTTPVAAFGSRCTVSPETASAPFGKLVERIATKFGVMDTACAVTEIRESKQAAKKIHGTKTTTIRGIPKLTDANWAGGSRSSSCMLFLVEGDSAKSGAMSGNPDRNTVGIYPLKGKLLNVRGMQRKDISANAEIENIAKIMGLELGRSYTVDDAKSRLRYGRIVFLTDQDLDGDHIKGLVINMFHEIWPSLLAVPGLFCTMSTPLVKATHGASTKLFYSSQEYEAWKSSSNTSKWKIKYYKGLGTSTGNEWKEYMSSMRLVEFAETSESNDRIDMMFNKKRADERKTLLLNYDETLTIDGLSDKIGYDDFMERGLIHFSNADCQRSIPSMMDGLKTSQRKCLYAAFKRNLRDEIKVAQFSGYVSEVAAYHHGEASLNGTIVGMAQTFVGANNINMFMPNGQFGTRLKGGTDAASPRYIFTQLNPISYFIFPSSDVPVLQTREDDGMPVEPVWYAPVIPMIAVNGTRGIGTGFSTDIPPHSPRDVTAYVKAVLLGKPLPRIQVFFAGFTGSIAQYTVNDDRANFLAIGRYTVKDKTVNILDLPPGCWTEDYKIFLEKCIETKIIRTFKDNSNDVSVDITLDIEDVSLLEATPHTICANWKGEAEGAVVTKLEHALKLYATFRTSNMHAFDSKGALKKYATVYDIIDDYIPVRLEIYKLRRARMLANLSHDVSVATNKARFIQCVINDEVVLRNQTKKEVAARLDGLAFSKDEDGTFNYLTRMPMDSMTYENVNKLNADMDQKLDEMQAMERTTPKSMWLADLDALSQAMGSPTVGKLSLKMKN